MNEIVAIFGNVTDDRGTGSVPTLTAEAVKVWDRGTNGLVVAAGEYCLLVNQQADAGPAVHPAGATGYI